MKQKNYWPLVLIILFGIGSGAAAQNINKPNKMGPLGTEVNTFTGNMYLPRTDISIPARGFSLSVEFYYNSYNYDSNVGFGKGWNFCYNIKYINDTANGKTIFWGDGREDSYTALAGGSFRSPKGYFSAFSQYQPGKFLLTETDGTRFYFDNATHRRITRMEEPNGNYISLSYSDTLLTAVINNAGQTISFAYDASGRLTTVTDAMVLPARIYTYTYNASNNLTQVTDPLGGMNKYTYLVNGPMKTVTDKNNNTVDIIYYNDFSLSELIGCNKRISMSYDTLSKVTVITDHLASGNNQVTTYQYKDFDGIIGLVKKTGNCCGSNMVFDYDASGNIISQTDANGNTTSFTHDARGNITSITDALGQVTTYTYGPNFNNIVSVTDPKGNTRTISYDSKGNLVTLTEPGGLVTSLTYSALGELLTVTNPRGNVTRYTYDVNGNPATVGGPLGYSISFVYDARGNLLSATDPRGYTYSNQYDVLNRLKVSTDPLGRTSLYQYDAEGNVTEETDEKGHKNLFAYDASNRLVRETDALGHFTTYVYDAMDNMLQVRDAAGNTGVVTYDNRNRVTSIKDPMGNTDYYGYDAVGNLTVVSYSTGRVVNYAYDKLNRRVQASDFYGIVSTISYDANNNIASVKNATDGLYTFAYDALDRKQKVTDPLGNSKSYTYDNNSNVISVTDRNGKVFARAYDALDRLVGTQDANGFTTSVGYDLANNITSVTDQNGRTTSYLYDNLGRRTKTTFPDGKFMQYGYDELANIISKRLTDGTTINYQYDSLNRMVSKALPGGNIFSYAYDNVSRLVSAVNNDAAISIVYDALSRMTAETTNGKTTRYGYNVAARYKTILYPDSTNITKQYDTRSRLTGVTKNNATIATYQYNNANQLTARNYSNGVNTVIQYDFANRISSIVAGNGSVQNLSFSFDKDMNKTAVAKNNFPNESEQYSYDAAYRISNASRGPLGGPAVQQTAFTYDAVGNRATSTTNGSATTYAANNMNQLTSAAGSSTNISFTYDNNGNLTYDGTFFKTYDAEGRLMADSASPSNKITYKYDALNRRIQKNVNGVAVRYSYDGLSQIEQRDANTDTLLNRSVFNGALSPIYTEKGNNKYYYHQNEMNSVEAITDAGGNLSERYRYDAYGKQTVLDASNTVQANSPSGNRFGFTGQEYDAETGSNRFHFRNYSPATGTFNQRDPIGYGDGMGMYQYVSNNPVNGIDILGLEGRGPRDHGTPHDWTPEEMKANQELGESLHTGAKGTKDANAILSGLKDLIEKNSEYKDAAINFNEKFLKKLDYLSKTKAFEKFKNLLKQSEKFGFYLKSFFLLEKIGKLFKMLFWECGKWKEKSVLGVEIGLSAWSLRLGYLTIFKKVALTGGSAVAKRLLGVFSLLDASSSITTGKGVITNTLDLPMHVHDLENALWQDIVGENEFGSFDDVMTGNGHLPAGNWGSPSADYMKAMPYWK